METNESILMIGISSERMWKMDTLCNLSAKHSTFVYRGKYTENSKVKEISTLFKLRWENNLSYIFKQNITSSNIQLCCSSPDYPQQISKDTLPIQSEKYLIIWCTHMSKIDKYLVFASNIALYTVKERWNK
jgi:hypothetical protein